MIIIAYKNYRFLTFLKSKTTLYENMHFNSVVIIIDIIIILANPTVLRIRTVLLLWTQYHAKKLVGAYVCLLPGGSNGVPKMAIFEIRKCTKTAKLIHYRAKCCQKYALYRKRLQIKKFLSIQFCTKKSMGTYAYLLLEKS